MLIYLSKKSAFGSNKRFIGLRHDAFIRRLYVQLVHGI